MDSIALKKQFRKELKKQRMALSAEELSERSQAIFEHWQNQFSLEGIQYVHLFLSMDRFNEVHTEPFRKFIERSKEGAKILVPVMNTLHETLQHYELAETIEIEKNKFGVPEPRIQKRPIGASKIDMVIIPMLGFNLEGHRLGYGKGYYDRFLAQLRPECLKIGVCFELGKQLDLPYESHDVPLDFVITEEKVYTFSETNSLKNS